MCSLLGIKFRTADETRLANENVESFQSISEWMFTIQMCFLSICKAIYSDNDNVLGFAWINWKLFYLHYFKHYPALKHVQSSHLCWNVVRLMFCIESTQTPDVVKAHQSSLLACMLHFHLRFFSSFSLNFVSLLVLCVQRWADKQQFASDSGVQNEQIAGCNWQVCWPLHA